MELGCGVWGVGCKDTSYYFPTAFGGWESLTGGMFVVTIPALSHLVVKKSQNQHPRMEPFGWDGGLLAHGVFCIIL